MSEKSLSDNLEIDELDQQDLDSNQRRSTNYVENEEIVNNKKHFYLIDCNLEKYFPHKHGILYINLTSFRILQNN